MFIGKMQNRKCFYCVRTMCHLLLPGFNSYTVLPNLYMIDSCCTRLNYIVLITLETRTGVVEKPSHCGLIIQQHHGLKHKIKLLEEKFHFFTLHRYDPLLYKRICLTDVFLALAFDMYRKINSDDRFCIVIQTEIKNTRY